MRKIILEILAERDDTSIMSDRKRILKRYVDLYGVDNVTIATGLLESTLKQYITDSQPRIGAGPVDRAIYVFESQKFKDAIR